MPIPDFQSVMRPMLALASDGRDHLLSDAREALAVTFGLTDEEKKALLPSGRQAKFGNRVAWAKVYLTRAGALDAPKRGYFRITERGRALLKEIPDRATIKVLMDRFPEIVEFRSAKLPRETTGGSEPEEEKQTPEELLENSYQRFRSELASELLKNVTASSPQFFERLVVELLLNMGYGGSRKELTES